MTPAGTGLPIEPLLGEIAGTLAAHGNLVLVAPPGAGKTTCVPLRLLEEPWTAGRRLILLEPRRLAARAAAERMASLIGERVGETVGLRMRNDTRVGPATRIEVVTEGVFARMALDDPELGGVAAILFDEVHERSLDGDLGLALARDVQTGLRDDLRLVAMSATLDGAAFARLLDAPLIESEGRAFPVETIYRGRPRDKRVEDAAADAIIAALDRDGGSLLVFLPGAGEIARTAERLAERLDDTAVIVAPLYGTLDRAAQDAAIRPAPEDMRKVVLATSIAETSLTIEGVRIVVDCGLSRRPRFDPASGLTRLETVRVSRAAADQRRGRAGRTQPGLCYRLWDEPETRALAPSDRPEILQADLAPLRLALAEWGVADPTALSWLDAPPAGAFAEAGALLSALGALDEDGRITAHGRELSRLPLPPRLGHMILVSGKDAGLAAEIGAVLTERGLGGRSADIARRVEAMRAERSRRASDGRALAERWARHGGARAAGTDNPDKAGRLLALAFPDRLAKARGDRPGAFLLVNGRGAAIDEVDPLARATFLTVAETAGGGAEQRIVAAAAIAAEHVETLFADRIERGVQIGYDPATGSVRAREEDRIGAIVLATRPVAVPAGAAGAALTAAMAEGAAPLPLTPTQEERLARIAFMRRLEGTPWPDLSRERLAATAADWLAPFLGEATSLDALSEPVEAGLAALLPYDLARRLEAEAPARFEVPTGSQIALSYGTDGPVLAVRVQEMFGLARHPTVASGRVPILLELLSPAHRPVQVTRDLPGFWAGSYTAVRAEMRGRYPKHSWPEDPASAEPTRRAKRRET